MAIFTRPVADGRPLSPSNPPTRTPVPSIRSGAAGCTASSQVFEGSRAVPRIWQDIA
jgi:hypothetical protein